MRPSALAATALVGALQAAAAAPVAGVVVAQPSIGVIGGLNLATFTGSSSVTVAGRRAGVMLGAVAEVPIGGSFSLRPELHYSAKGARAITAGSGREGVEFSVSYLQLPLLVQVQPTFGSSVVPALLGGVSVGLPLRCRRGGLACKSIPGFARHSVDAGVVVGIEAGFFGVAAAGVRYEAGLRSVDKSPHAELLNGVLSFTVRYALLQTAPPEPRGGR